MDLYIVDDDDVTVGVIGTVEDVLGYVKWGRGREVYLRSL